MYNTSISFQILPLELKGEEALKIIDKVIKMVQKSGISYQIGPLETTMEGDLDILLEIVRKAQILCVRSGAKTVFTNVKIIYNPEGVLTIAQKTDKYKR